MKPFTIDNSAEFYFCTDVIVGWQYVSTSPQFFDVIINTLKHCQENKGLRVHGFVIMPNHVHTILSAEQSNLSDILRDYKRYTSKTISGMLQISGANRLTRYFSQAAKTASRGNTYKVWQQGSHPEAITSQKFFVQKLNYIHENPVRKGYVEKPEHWVYSSARNYFLGDDTIIKIDKLE